MPEVACKTCHLFVYSGILFNLMHLLLFIIYIYYCVLCYALMPFNMGRDPFGKLTKALCSLYVLHSHLYTDHKYTDIQKSNTQLGILYRRWCNAVLFMNRVWFPSLHGTKHSPGWHFPWAIALVFLRDVFLNFVSMYQLSPVGFMSRDWLAHGWDLILHLSSPCGIAEHTPCVATLSSVGGFEITTVAPL